MTFNCDHGMSPAYFHDVCNPVASVKGHMMLKSGNYGELIELRMKGKCYGPHSLPKHLLTDDVNGGQFVQELRMFSFARAYTSEAPRLKGTL